MGFSTSGAVLVILIGILAALGVLVPTLFTVGAETGEAFAAQHDQLREQQNVALEVERFALKDNTDPDDPVAVVNVTNTGTESLSIHDTDVLVNGEYYRTDGYEDDTRIVDGNDVRTETNIWAPDTHLEVEIVANDLENFDPNADPDTEEEGEHDDRVQVTTEYGIADSAELEDVQP
ncbi:hypothetical protein [Halopiger goleimassiliensis]|uniref:hypothetical protein n=1 Tax=Halopiger goleimassiliensis TaxID=1293048 RepID=UPI000677A7B1|nr:hypothetical protein [Halopiger goleimassiliensis]